MTKVAVVAHAGKSFGGGLTELRRELERHGVADPMWVEVPKSRFAPKQVECALADGADLLFVCDGDGTVQRSIDAMAGSETPLAAKKIKVKLSRKVLYEVDGGDREKVRSFTVKVQPAAITVCLPREERSKSDNGSA